jgi:hypothetical protein
MAQNLEWASLEQDKLERYRLEQYGLVLVTTSFPKRGRSDRPSSPPV